MGGDEELGGVEEVLPDDVSSGSERSEGIEVGVGHPDTEGSIFLSEGLSCGDRRDTRHRFGCSGRVDEHILVVTSFGRSGEVVADQFAETELENTSDKRAC